MENFKYALDGAWQVLVVGLVLGVGLPAIFALGIRSMAIGTSAVVAGDGPAQEAGASVLGKTLATICFGVVIVAVAIGIATIVAAGQGKDLSFAHGYPTIVAK